MLINLDIISCFSQTVHLCCTFPDRQLPEKVQKLPLLLVFKRTNYTFLKHFQTTLLIDGEYSRLWSLRALRTFRVKDVASLAECPRPVWRGGRWEASHQCRATLTTADFLSAGANSYFRWFLKSPYKTGLYNNNCQKKRGPIETKTLSDNFLNWLAKLNMLKDYFSVFFFLIKINDEDH